MKEPEPLDSDIEEVAGPNEPAPEVDARNQASIDSPTTPTSPVRCKLSPLPIRLSIAVFLLL